jgi:hypothetical protein
LVEISHGGILVYLGDCIFPAPVWKAREIKCPSLQKRVMTLD